MWIVPTRGEFILCVSIYQPLCIDSVKSNTSRKYPLVPLSESEFWAPWALGLMKEQLMFSCEKWKPSKHVMMFCIVKLVWEFLPCFQSQLSPYNLGQFHLDLSLITSGLLSFMCICLFFSVTPLDRPQTLDK